MKKVDDLTFEELCPIIRREFDIRVTGVDFVGPYIKKSMRLRGLADLIGEGVATRMARKALKSPDQVFVQKLRRGLTVKFYSN